MDRKILTSKLQWKTPEPLAASESFNKGTESKWFPCENCWSWRCLKTSYTKTLLPDKNCHFSPFMSADKNYHNYCNISQFTTTFLNNSGVLLKIHHKNVRRQGWQNILVEISTKFGFFHKRLENSFKRGKFFLPTLGRKPIFFEIDNGFCLLPSSFPVNGSGNSHFDKLRNSLKMLFQETMKQQMTSPAPPSLRHR